MNTASTSLICSQQTTVQNEQPRVSTGNKPQTAFCFSKTGKGEIEGTIMLCQVQTDKWKYTQKSKTYSKLGFLLYIYSVTPHFRQGGRREEARFSRAGTKKKIKI